MTKRKVTGKWLKDNLNCISVGYCDLQYLLQYESPLYYNCGVYGWNYDVYVIGNYALCTGYRGMPSTVKTVKNKYDIEIEYDRKAEKIINEWTSFSTDEFKKKKERLSGLISEMIEKIIVK